MKLNANEYLIDLINNLVDYNVKFIICGGVAVVLHGVERLTIDLDLSVDMSTDNLIRFLEVLKRNNMVPRAPIPAESILDKDILNSIVQQKKATVFTFIDTLNPIRQLDIFITEDKCYKAIIKDTKEIVLDKKRRIKIVSLDKLIDMKREINPKRDKDIFDIDALLKIKKKTDEK